MNSPSKVKKKKPSKKKRYKALPGPNFISVTRLGWHVTQGCPGDELPSEEDSLYFTLCVLAGGDIVICMIFAKKCYIEMSNFHPISAFLKSFFLISISAFSKSLFHTTSLEFILTKIEANNLKNKLSIFFTSFILSSKKVSVLHIPFFHFRHW